MEMDRATGVLVALRRYSLEEASDEILDVSKRHRVTPLAVARGLVSLAEGDADPDDPAVAAALRVGNAAGCGGGAAMIRQTAVRVRRVCVAVWRCPNMFVCWSRRTYPKWAPHSGHVALVALCGQDGSLIEQRPRPAG